jgi:hypothetical protein
MHCLTVNTSAANAKSMDFVQSIVACWSRFACPGCLWGYCHNTSLDPADSSQYTTHYTSYRVKSDAQDNVMQPGLALERGKILAFGK